VNQAEELVEEQVEEQEVEQVEQEGEEKPEGEAKQAEGEDDGVTITIGEESPSSEAEAAPEWVRELRKENAAKAKRIRELEQEREQRSPPQALGAEPTLEGCDYDAVKYATDLKAYLAKKGEHEAKERSAREAEQKQQEAFRAKEAAYTTAKSALKVPDYDDAEQAATDILSDVQRNIVIGISDSPAQLMYVLGKNPQKCRELAALDPAKFIYEAAKLETKVKVQPRREVPAPEKTIKGGGPTTSSDAHLAKLRAEADRTGDRTKVVAYMREQKRKAA
jgi:hypothetical protein